MASTHHLTHIAAIAVLVLAAAPAQAQRADAPYTGNTVPQGSPIPRILPSEPPAVGPGATPQPPAVPAAVPDVPVPVSSVSIIGVTVFAPPRTAPLVAGLVGPATSLRRIEQARSALVSLYRQHGYVLTTVNAELGAGGALRFSVVEGRVVDVKLDGNIGPAGVQVLRFLRHLTEVQALNNATLERWLLLAQDIPGITLNAVLLPSADEPGALLLVAKVHRKIADGLLTVDNRASRLTGPEEGLAILDINSLTQLGERTELSLYHTNGNTQNFGQLSTEFFVGGSGLRVKLYAGTGKSTPSDYLRVVDYQGFTDSFGASAIYPVIRSRQQTFNAVASLDALQTEIRSDTGAAAHEPVRTSRDSFRAVRIAGEYALEDIWLGSARPAADYAMARLSRGFPGGTNDDNPLPGRQHETLHFTAANFELSRTQTLYVPWHDASVALKTRLLGQVSGDILPPAEEYFLGGSDIDRGFYSGEVSGDSAFTQSAELQLNTGVRVSPFAHPIEVDGQFYLFYDHGQTWQNGGGTDAHLSSEGLGSRISLTRYAEFDIEADIRNTTLPIGTAGVVRPLKADAVYWRVLARF